MGLFDVRQNFFNDITYEKLSSPENLQGDHHKMELLMKHYELSLKSFAAISQKRWVQHRFFSAILLILLSVLILRNTGAIEGFTLSILAASLAFCWYQTTHKQVKLDTYHLHILSLLERELLMHPWTILNSLVEKHNMKQQHVELSISLLLFVFSVVILIVYSLKLFGGIDLSTPLLTSRC